MMLHEALATGLPLRRKNKTTWRHRNNIGYSNTLADTYICPDYLLNSAILLSKEDILATDWEVLQPEPEVTITADSIKTAFNKHVGNLVAIEAGCCGRTHLAVANDQVLLRLMLEDLGLQYD